MSHTDKQDQKLSPTSGTRIVAIASGKGGVGKSTVTTNLALALKGRGKKVGIIDADIYGPSQVQLLGAIGERHNLKDQKLMPLTKHGISFVSMASLMAEDQPVIWRAPMAVKVIQQFLYQVDWGPLDYLLIDLPPGTGDIQLTLAQQTELFGAVIVTTPQQVAVGVARKGLQMFSEVGVPILGIIENMQGLLCGHCHQLNYIFGRGGGEALAKQFATSYLGGIPLDSSIVQSGDLGQPIVMTHPDSLASQSFIQLAINLEEICEVEFQQQKKEKPSEIVVSSSGALQISWSDGLQGQLEARGLRYACPCAMCVSEDTGMRMVRLSDIPLNVTITEIQPVGRYGVALHFSDQHKTGIYRFQDLREMVDRHVGSTMPEEFNV